MMQRVMYSVVFRQGLLVHKGDYTWILCKANDERDNFTRCSLCLLCSACRSSHCLEVLRIRDLVHFLLLDPDPGWKKSASGMNIPPGS
jgi:hypothetical protein